MLDGADNQQSGVGTGRSPETLPNDSGNEPLNNLGQQGGDPNGLAYDAAVWEQRRVAYVHTDIKPENIFGEAIGQG
jgi:hypothetical protein